MHFLRCASLLLLIVSGQLSAGEVPIAAPPSPPSLAGHWEGEIVLPQMPLTIRCDLKHGEDGAYSGTIDIPQQGAVGLPLEGIELDGAALRFAIGKIPGQPRFAGKAEGERISGQFSQNGQTFDFQLEKRAKVAPKRPQLPVPPFPYRELEVSFGHDEVQLAATLTLPPGEGPFPALMLFSGSGAQDRDCTIFDHKPFLLLADRLTRAGFAVLRADDRGVPPSTGDRSQATTEDFIEDARAGIRFLAGRLEIDKQRIGMYGHSEGALVAAGVAARGELAFLILAAGPGVNGSAVIVEQLRRITLASGMAAEKVSLLTAQMIEMHRSVKDARSDKEAERHVVELGLGLLRQQKGEAAIDAADREAVKQQARQVSSPWFRHFLTYDPAVNLERIKIPVLVLQGELDLQVSADQNLPKVEASLAKAGNRDVTIRRLPGLNHLLQPAKTGLIGEYGEIGATIDENALTAITDFLARFAHAAPKEGSSPQG